MRLHDWSGFAALAALVLALVALASGHVVSSAAWLGGAIALGAVTRYWRVTRGPHAAPAPLDARGPAREPLAVASGPDTRAAARRVHPGDRSRNRDLLASRRDGARTRRDARRPRRAARDARRGDVPRTGGRCDERGADPRRRTRAPLPRPHVRRRIPGRRAWGDPRRGGGAPRASPRAAAGWAARRRRGRVRSGLRAVRRARAPCRRRRLHVRPKARWGAVLSGALPADVIRRLCAASLRKGGGLGDAQGRWRVAAKGEYPFMRLSACGVRSTGRLDLCRSKVLPARRIDAGRVAAPHTRMATGSRGTELSELHMIVLGRSRTARSRMSMTSRAARRAGGSSGGLVRRL